MSESDQDTRQGANTGRKGVVVDPEEAPRNDLAYDRGSVVHLADPSVGAQRLDFHLNILRAGAPAGPYHMHTNAENVYHILEGEVRVRIDGVDYDLGPGMVAFMPPGIAHSATNLGDTDARLLEIYAPPDRDFVLVDEDGSKR